MTERILCVDDDPNALAAFQRRLRGRFPLDVAHGAADGLTAIERRGPYAVVISDLGMPGMNGVQFLAAVRQRAPDTVRIMLTGHADIDAAMAAVNEGNIFRFLTKPVDMATFAGAIRAAIEQHRLITAERELLAKTLHGSVKVLTDVLSLVNPAAFSKTARLERYVKFVAERLNLRNTWVFELAAMLSQIGCVALPTEVLQRINVGTTPTDEDQRLFNSHPDVARRLLLNIPRLEPVAEMIAHQREPYLSGTPPVPIEALDRVVLGAEILKVVLDFDRLVVRGLSPRQAAARLRSLAGGYQAAIIDGLADFEGISVNMRPKPAAVRDLVAGMVFDQDVRARTGVLLVSKGQEITPLVLERLRRFASGTGVDEPIRVLVAPNRRAATGARASTTSEA